MDEKSYQILIMNLLNRAVDLNIAQGIYDVESIDGTLEELKDIVRNQIMNFRAQHGSNL